VAADSPAAAPVAASAVLAAASGPAKIAISGAGARGPGGCIQRTFKVSVRGARILHVDFTLDGRTLARVTRRDSSGLYRTTVTIGGLARKTHRIKARVAFIAGTAPRTRTLPVLFRRCALVATAPAFAG
jgi:hypothetical protein